MPAACQATKTTKHPPDTVRKGGAGRLRPAPRPPPLQATQSGELPIKLFHDSPKTHSFLLPSGKTVDILQEPFLDAFKAFLFEIPLSGWIPD